MAPGQRHFNGPQPSDEADDLNLGTEAPTLAALIEVLRRQPPPRGGSRLRQHERIRCAVPSTVFIDTPGTTAPPLKVITDDVSAGGFAFVCERHLAIGTPIRIQFGALESPPLQAVVRHCTSIDGVRHRVGARLIEPIQSPKSS